MLMFSLLYLQIIKIDAELNGDVDRGLKSLQEIFNTYTMNISSKDRLETLIVSAMNAVQDILSEVDGIAIEQEITSKFDSGIHTSKMFGFYRSGSLKKS